MKIFVTKTGIGYYLTEDGKVFMKFDLVPGEHSIDDNLTAIDVSDRVELEQVKVYKEPPSEEIVLRVIVNKKIRDMAIDALEADGEITKKQSDDLKGGG